MTENDKASDSLLTEEAYAAGTGAGNRPTLPYCPSDWQRYHWDLCRREGIPTKWTPEHSVRWTQLSAFAREDYVRLLDEWEVQANKLNVWLEGFLEWRKKQRRTNAYGENQHQLGPREFTLTYSPTWGWNDEEAQETMKSAIEKLTRYYKDEIIEFHAIGEFGRDGRSHVHGWYHLTGGRKITDKNFKRAYPRWNPKRKLGKGFEGGHHQTIQRTSDFAGYAEKHLDEAWLKTDITNAVQSPPSDAP